MPPKAKRNPSNPPKAAASPKAPAAVATLPAKARGPFAAAGALALSPTAPAAKARGPSASSGPAAKARTPATGKASLTAGIQRPPEEVKGRALEAEQEKDANAATEVLRSEAAKKAEEEQKQKEKEAAEVELKRLAALADGEVTIKYNMYAEKFKIEGHSLTAQAIDEVYCLSDVMPGCFIHLGEREFGYGEEHAYIKEEPSGTFRGLMADEVYWCYVQQDPEQEKRDQEAMKGRWAGQAVGGGLGDRGAEGETCSCGWGAPCTNPMICKDWDNRFANAIKAGGNPILFMNT